VSFEELVAEVKEDILLALCEEMREQLMKDASGVKGIHHQVVVAKLQQLLRFLIIDVGS